MDNLEVLPSTAILKISNIVSPSDCRVVMAIVCQFRGSPVPLLVMESQLLIVVASICQRCEQLLKKRILVLKNGLLSREQLELC